MSILSTEKLLRIIETLYFVRHSKQKVWFIHNVNGIAMPLEGLEGAAYFNEKNTELVLKLFPNYEAIKVIDLAKELPITLKDFVPGHPLFGCQVNVRDLTIKAGYECH